MPSVKAATKGGFLTQRQIIDRLYAQAMKVLRGQENESIRRLMDSYRLAQDNIVAQIFSRFGDAEGWTLQQWEESGRLRGLLQAVEETLGRLQAAADGEISRGASVQFFGSYDQTAWTLDQATPPTVPVTYARPPEDAVRVLTATPYKGAMFSQRIGLITNAMAADIRDELTQALIQGEGAEAAARRVRDIIGISSKNDPRSYTNRARVIARTEIMRAQNLAREFAYEQNKDLLEDGETEWLVTPDDRLCPWCMRREGLSDAEIEASNPGNDPWGNSTDVPLHPNCRCTKVPRLKKWKDLIGLDMPEALDKTARGIRDADGEWTIVKPERFERWLEKRTGEMDVELSR
jgi:SPP1 gp7 family putative phage head morphogenesis protein